MSTFTLSGSGTHALSAGTTGLQVTITTPSTIGGVGRSNPVAKYDQGLLRFSDGTAYWPPIPILGGPQFVPVPANATSIGYALLGGAEVSVTEVIGGTVFFSGGTQSLETLSDVQVASIADTQILAWNAAASKWANVNQPSGPGGGGLTHSYLGHNAIGASTETMTSRRVYLKQFTPSSDGLIVGLGVYLHSVNGATPNMESAILADNAGAPGNVIAFGPYTSTLFNNNTSRWLTFPMSLYVMSGTPYWLGFQTTGTTEVIAYDTGGSDDFYTATSIIIGDAGFFADNTTTKNYSIRADFLS